MFDIDDASVRLHASLADVNTRSAALCAVIGALYAEGRIPGWRDEIYAIRNDFDAAPLAFIERAASRFFGTMTYAVHLNGIVKYRDKAPQLWIARRSDTKATDPGMLDNIVAGGIGWGFELMPTLVKECWEEAGMSAEIARTAERGRTFHVVQSLPEGTQAEQVFVYDVSLPPDFAPRNQDGEVGAHRGCRALDRGGQAHRRCQSRHARLHAAPPVDRRGRARRHRRAVRAARREKRGLNIKNQTNEVRSCRPNIAFI
ncbi:NTP pyrophosphohydrolase including oxidative damage repair enzyme [Candidatus Paraburkholderia schumanniana]|nr:NTP pyrophosphohydrolase including oxidative damage repair enzyme [Candidatus Paraburkholderia schumannianae]